MFLTYPEHMCATRTSTDALAWSAVEPSTNAAWFIARLGNVAAEDYRDYLFSAEHLNGALRTMEQLGDLVDLHLTVHPVWSERKHWEIHRVVQISSSILPDGRYAVYFFTDDGGQYGGLPIERQYGSPANLSDLWINPHDRTDVPSP